MKRWTPLLGLLLLALNALLVWALLPDRRPSDDELTNPTITRLEQEVDSLRAVVSQRDAAIAAYEGRVASLDASLSDIARRNGDLLATLDRQRRPSPNAPSIPNDSLARDLNRILRSGELAGRVAAGEAGIPR